MIDITCFQKMNTKKKENKLKLEKKYIFFLCFLYNSFIFFELSNKRWKKHVQLIFLLIKSSFVSSKLKQSY